MIELVCICTRDWFYVEMQNWFCYAM